MRAAYSALLAQATSVPSSPTDLGGPPAGYLWVVRFAAATFGSYLAYVNCGLAVQPGNPWLWLMQSTPEALFSVHPTTFYWEGRLVVPAGASLYAQASAGDECDLYVSGYQLTVAGS
jgi:hypothetical protein